jgi:hypothetical protein
LFIPIALNGGMPVSESAMQSAGITEQQLEAALRFKHRISAPDTRLSVLGDVIPLPPPMRRVIAVGDVALAVGMGSLVSLGMVRASAHLEEGE